MAITSAALQTELGETSMQSPRVLRQLPPYGSTLQYWLIHGNQAYHGTVKRISTTASDDAATQAAAVLTALALGSPP
jgi:hypothetical protein